MLHLPTMSATSLSLSAQLTTDSPLGPILLARTPAGLAGLWLAGQRGHPGQLPVPHASDDPLLLDAAVQLAAFWRGDQFAFNLPLTPLGTPFQLKVWRGLNEITFGRTTTYQSVANALGQPSAVRAVASAIGRNPLSVIVPCHRVLGSNGALTGYAGGLERKAWLLAHEQTAAGQRRVAA